MSEIVEYSSEGRVATITLNRPEARNAVNGDVAQGLGRPSIGWRTIPMSGSES